jgi:imidazoleglycerol-phosphate dehydratase
VNRQGTARVSLGSGTSRIATGVAVLDHLLGQLAETGRFQLSLETAPGKPEVEVGAAGTELGEALAPLLRADGALGHGVGIMPADEALAMVVVDVSTNPLVASNADLSSTRVAGLETDFLATFLERLAEGASLTIHVRLIEGEDSQHVLSAIFKALGAALAQACAEPSGAGA